MRNNDDDERDDGECDEVEDKEDGEGDEDGKKEVAQTVV
jgi:hypothetical protein